MRAEPEAQIELEWSGNDPAIMRLLGEHDVSSAEQVAGGLRMLARRGKNIVVDLSETTLIDSAILYTLLDAHATLQRGDGRLVLQLGPEPAVRRLLELGGLLDRLRNAPTRDEALELASAPANTGA